MKKYTLEELGWEFVREQSDVTYLVYKRDDEYLYINLDKRKVEFATEDDVTFATLEAIRELVINNAIY